MHLRDLEREGVYTRITTSVTPPLAEMLANKDLMRKYVAYLDRILELCAKEKVRVYGDENFAPVATMYEERFAAIKSFFLNDLNGNVLNGYRKYNDNGMLCVITCGATHGFFPFMTENAVRAQLEVACRIHEKHFGVRPKGIWLPECAYYAGADKLLADVGIEFFFVDSHGILYADPRPKYGTYAPVFTSNGVAAFGRDYYSSKQVWSSKEGYPGDTSYRDFYRDVGYDLDMDYIAPYISPDGERVFTGLKYHKITGESDFKEAYNREVALNRTKDHARHFVQERVKQLADVAAHMDREPHIVSPYDAELFGHWWFEGTDFIANIFRELKNTNITPITPLEYLQKFRTNQVVQVNPSSWGDKGYYSVWLNSGNDWIYRHLRFMADSMHELAVKYSEAYGDKQRVLNQMARELLLAQSSDWAFLITTGTAAGYSIQRTKEHIHNFMKLYTMVEENRYDFEYLVYIEGNNDYYPEIDFRVYR
jgi:1,4-alpha-glucan branching enzyme